VQHCVTKPIDKYTEVINGTEVGLYITYGHDRHLFNLLTRTSTAMFMYEQGFESLKTGSRFNRLTKEELLFSTLSQSLGGVSMRKTLETTSPQGMLKIFKEKRPEHLDIAGLYGNFPRLLQAMELRVLQYRKYYRGPLSKGGIVKVQFASDLSSEEDTFLENNVKALLRGFSIK